MWRNKIIQWKKKFHEITKWTLFVFACNYGHKYVVKLFLDYLELTIKLNRTTNGGKTAFICACLKGYKDVVKLLSNIEVNVRTNYGWTEASNIEFLTLKLFNFMTYCLLIKV